MKHIILSLVVLISSLILIGFIVQLILNKIRYFQNKRIIRNITISIFTLLIYFLLSNLVFSYLLKTPEMKFNETSWKENITNRYKMINDLVDSKYLIGKDKGKIKSIFGEPNEANGYDDFWVYKLVGRTWADFKTIELKLNFKENVVKEVFVIKK